MASPISTYTLELAKIVLDKYSDGIMLKDICGVDGVPSRWTVYKWRIDNPDFDKLWLLAAECNADVIVEQAFKNVMGADPKEAKLVDVQFKSSSWLASKINRAKYGDKLDITQTVAIDLSPALLEATKRMQAVGVGSPQIPLIETQAKEI